MANFELPEDMQKMIESWEKTKAGGLDTIDRRLEEIERQLRLLHMEGQGLLVAKADYQANGTSTDGRYGK